MAQGLSQGVNLYHMLIQTTQIAEVNLTASNDLRMWHERFGHASLKSIREMVKKGTLNIGYIPQDIEFFCGPCQFGKQHRLPFYTAAPRHTKAGELIHTDVGGPMQQESIGGSRFYVIFKDDASGFTQIYFLKHKSDVYERFKEYYALVNNKFGYSIKALRMDNGTEYLNHNLKQFLTTRGIQLELTAPYTPKQNGSSERQNRTLVEKARTMIHAKDLQIRLWAEAMNTAVYTYNRTPLFHKDNKTPYEMWTGKKTRVDHLKTFGCDAYVHVPKQQRRKWDKKSKKMIFVGYQNDSTNYRLFDPEKGRVTVSRDVIFDERNLNKDTSNDNEMTLPICQIDEEDEQPQTHFEEKDVTDQRIQEQKDKDDIRMNQEVEPSCVEQNIPKRHLRDRDRIKRPMRYEANLAEFVEPKTYEEAISGPNAESWRTAINEELTTHHKNKTWRMETLPKGKTAIGCKWVFKIKNSSQDASPRYKARLCAKEYTQKAGIDYEEVFAPVVRYESIRTLLATAAEYDLEIAQFDVRTAFLHGDLHEEIFMAVPEGIELKEDDKVCRLLKSLYGLKQASRQWNVKFNSFLKLFNLVPSSADPCVYRGYINNTFIFLALYVDDGILLAETKETLNVILEKLKKFFEVTICTSNTFIGLQIERNKENHSIFIHQRTYIEHILTRFEMKQARPVGVPIDSHTISSIMNDKGELDVRFPYREAMGSLIFLAQLTRPDITFAVSLLSRFLTCYTESHWQAVKRIFRYLAGTVNLGICYKKGNESSELSGYSDADYAGDVETRRSTTGYLFIMANGPIS